MFEGNSQNNEINPDAEKSKHFWSDIWDKDVKQNKNAKWLLTVKKGLEDRLYRVRKAVLLLDLEINNSNN